MQCYRYIKIESTVLFLILLTLPRSKRAINRFRFVSGNHASLKTTRYSLQKGDGPWMSLWVSDGYHSQQGCTVSLYHDQDTPLRNKILVQIQIGVPPRIQHTQSNK